MDFSAETKSIFPICFCISYSVSVPQPLILLILLILLLEYNKFLFLLLLWILVSQFNIIIITISNNMNHSKNSISSPIKLKPILNIVLTQFPTTNYACSLTFNHLTIYLEKRSKVFVLVSQQNPDKCCCVVVCWFICILRSILMFKNNQFNMICMVKAHT